MAAVTSSNLALKTSSSHECLNATCHARISISSARGLITHTNKTNFVGVKTIRRPSGCSKKENRRESGLRVTAAAASDDLPSLNNLPLISYINQQGFILPPVEPNTKASVFAIFDKNKKIQYVGFSKDIRNTLRTLLGRRPEFCYFFKLANLSELDQEKMLAIRSQWYSELGLPPVGNTDPVQKKFWEQPVDAGAVSERGKAAAASSKSRTLLQMMVDRGLQEEMVFDPALLEKGLCDILPTETNAEDMEKQRAAADEAKLKVRNVLEKSPAGEEIQFEIEFENKIVTNGGWMFDVFVTRDDKRTRHRIVCGRIYPESTGMHEIDFICRLLAFLLWTKVPRQTEGVLTSEQFNINYFAVSEVSQKFSTFKEWFDGKQLPDNYWRFNRIHSYGNVVAPNVPTPLAPEIYTPKY